jgi:hypothetical protein
MDGSKIRSVQDVESCYTCLDAKFYYLKIQSKDHSNQKYLTSFCESDWASYSKTRTTVIDFTIYLLGVSICRRSREQKMVTLWSSEAEYVPISKVVEEIRFCFYYFSDMGVKFEIPIMVTCDNVGAIFMVVNSTLDVRTWHIDIHHLLLVNISRIGS